MLPQWYVYILQRLAKSFTYVGSTNNLPRRLVEHNEGLVQSTKYYRPLEIVAFIAVRTEKKARELEKYFKTGSGKAVLKKRILDDEAPPRERSRPLALRLYVLCLHPLLPDV